MAKKAGKKKAGKKEVPVEEETDWDRMDVPMLQEVVPMLHQQLEKIQADRNWTQLERDTVQTFYDITRQEVREFEMSIQKKDRDMEQMEDNHRVEVRVYVQKVKHLEYEHKNNLKGIDVDSEALMGEETDMSDGRVTDYKKSKKVIKDDLRERNLKNTEEISNVKQHHDKNLKKMREGFEANLNDLMGRCENKLVDLEEDLELRRKVDIHEIEERKNLHINDLMRNHEKAFGQMKSYYNDITNDNLKLIKSLKDEVSDLKKKSTGSLKLMYDISQENRRLSEPLAVAVAEVADLRTQLKDQEKDRLSLRNAKARLIHLESNLTNLMSTQVELKEAFAKSEGERNELYETFERTVKEVRAKSDFKNLVIEQKLQGMKLNVEKAGVQLQEVVSAADLDQGEVARITASLDEMLEGKNEHIKDLQYAVMRMTKSYNDGLRTYSQKLAEIGIPEDEIMNMGFAPAATQTSIVPAGLLAA
jgi:hypothetical protein